MAFLAGAVVALAAIGFIHGRSSSDASASSTQISETRSTTAPDMPPSDTEGYSEQAKTCLQWRTNYGSRWINDGPANGQAGYSRCQKARWRPVLKRPDRESRC
jgi:hypothetical protein